MTHLATEQTINVLHSLADKTLRELDRIIPTSDEERVTVKWHIENSEKLSADVTPESYSDGHNRWEECTSTRALSDETLAELAKTRAAVRQWVAGELNAYPL